VIQDEARVVAEAFKTDTLDRMNELARQHRNATLEAFRDLLIPELVAVVRERFPALPVEAVDAMVPACVTVVANRMAIDFDRLAHLALDPDGSQPTDPQELVPDTERP
jgi:hypothetical protein